MGVGCWLIYPNFPSTAVSFRTAFVRESDAGPLAMFFAVLTLLLFRAADLHWNEAVSTVWPIMREPRVYTAKRTMVYHGHFLA